MCSVRMLSVCVCVLQSAKKHIKALCTQVRRKRNKREDEKLK